MADLLHVYLEPEHCDVDWKSVKETIFELSEVFPFLEEEFADRIDKIIDTPFQSKPIENNNA